MARTSEMVAVASDTSFLPEQEVLIAPRRGWIAINWRELYTFRELLYSLTMRDIKIRYKQTVLGVAWAVLQPLLAMAIFTVIFGRFAKIPSDGVHYPLFVFAGLIPWTFFANSVGASSLSLVTQQNLLTKIYFPRLFVPTASVAAYVVDMGVSFLLFALMMAWYGVMPNWQVLLLPFPLALAILAAAGLSYTLSALTVLYRDFRYMVPFFIQVMLYVSPVIWSISILPKDHRLLYEAVLALNPMFGAIDGFRACLLGTGWHPLALAISSAMTLALFVIGLFFFRRTERFFADIA